MIKVLLSGCCGKMGAAVISRAADDDDIEIIAGVDAFPSKLDFPVSKTFSEVKQKPDVIIDFSNVSTLDGLLDYAVKNKIPALIATTGFNDEQIGKIKDAAKTIPVFFSANMSLGINVLCSLAKRAAAILGTDFDIEIVEKHHNRKIDAPSGTALMIADAIKGELDKETEYAFDRTQRREPRRKNEIGIHAVRGGTIVGEHEVIFAGNDEIVKISHSARSKSLFATGAVNAAAWLKGKGSGLYNMSDMISEV